MEEESCNVSINTNTNNNANSNTNTNTNSDYKSEKPVEINNKSDKI